MQPQTALVLGATGLIGSNVVSILLADDAYKKVRVLVRNKFDHQHPKLEVVKVDFKNVEAFKNSMSNGDVIFCCVGTTMKNVNGDKEAYRNVDYDIAVNAAKFGLVSGYNKYILVSSVGANAASANFYLKLKGEVENEIRDFSYRSTHIFQPSILLGARKELRLAEMVSKKIMQVASGLFFGSFAKYKAINANYVAKAMVAVSKSEDEGTRFYTYSSIKKLI